MIQKLQKFAVPVVAVCFVLLCLRFVGAYRNECKEIDEAYRNGLSVNLDKEVRTGDIKRVLLQRGIFTDEADAELVARTLADTLHTGRELASIYSLKQNAWKLPVTAIEEQGGQSLRAKASHAKEVVSLGFVPAVGGSQSKVDLNKGMGRIAVRVVEEDTAVEGVAVYLRQHFFNEEGNADDTVLAVAYTQGQGEVLFEGLDTASSYSVLPVCNGYEYGSSKGTVGGTLGRTERVSAGWVDKVTSIFNSHYGDLQYTFHQRPLRVPMFDDNTLRLIRESHAFTLRTPSGWKGMVSRMAVWFLLCWGVLCFVLWMRRRDAAVYWPVAALMGITGMGLLGMLSFNDPFADVLLGRDYLIGVGMGVAVMAVLQFVDIKEFYRSPKFDIISYKSDRKGIGYYLVAILLTLALFTPLGKQVGGMSVNLKIGPLLFQPSEIAKLLIVVFMSAWFCRKADGIVGYSKEGNIGLTWNKVRYVSGIFLALFGMLLIYLVLGDMGPGLVLLFSFIIIYSVVKSKSQYDTSSEGFMQGVLKSDIFLLLVGVGSFLLVVWIGGLLQAEGFFAGLWFVVWIVWWAVKKRQLVESPVMANAVISVFLFARNLPGSIGERFAMRSEMCTNPWGQLGLDGSMPHATPNGQVAEGLWGLASGGFWGQGFGNGSPNYIPAFHTDMVLSSLGEQMGWIGLLVIILLLLSVLHHTVAVGYRSRNHFSFFVCLGIAVVTAVQFAVIALGSTGVIPLTGVAVPLLSYGKVSMIFTLLAFGIVLSVETHTFAPREDNAADRAAENLFRPYSAPVAVTRTAWFVLTLFVLGVQASTMLFARNSTLVRPLYVTTQRGENIVQYNPRIAEITRALHPGNIYDRHGLLLATSTPDSIHIAQYARCGVPSTELRERLSLHTRRYYPLGDRLLFMVGDVNAKSPLAYYESTPLGYVAESQHMSYLRGYDNVLYADDEHKQPCYIDIVSDHYEADRYQPDITHSSNRVILRDYSVLLPFLKAGRNSNRIERVNERTSRYIQPQDLHLTLDATLQCRLQERIADYVHEHYPNMRLMRVSAVVLDANSGDMLASALYPLPNQDTLQNHAGEHYYNDNHFANGQWAYTDRDLGLTYLTAPGSTAKLMTAMAGLQKEGRRAAQQTFFIPAAEQVEVGKEPIGNVTMEKAIVMSSNCYFIHLMNHFNLYSTLDSIYSATGAMIAEDCRNGKAKSVTSYYLPYAPMSDAKRTVWKEIVSQHEAEGLARYQSYMRNRDRHPVKMNFGAWQWAWGQGTLAASPLGMARVVSAVANGGVMPKTRFWLDQPNEEGIRLVSNESADLLKGYLHSMAEGANGTAANAIHDPAVGGKTGTPERLLKGRKVNDGWFIFYVDGCTVRTESGSEQHSMAIAVRMERGVGSGHAMRLSRDVVLPVLRELGYRNN